MLIKELIAELEKDITLPSETTCDTFKSGDGESEIKKVGVTMFATVDTIRRVRDWGANFLIVHEPTFYDHWDKDVSGTVVELKKKLLSESRLTVYRYHDHPHYHKPDLISEGVIEEVGIPVDSELIPQTLGSTKLHLSEKITAAELAKRFEDRFGLSHIRISGTLDRPAEYIGLCPGTPGGVDELLRDPEVNIVLTGEICEWAWAEYARDADALGFNKSLITLGHIGSEMGGMIWIAKQIAEKHPEFETKFFDCGESYH